MLKTTFHIPQMDCPSEEQLIRLKLAGVAGVQQLDFSLAERRLEVIHRGPVEELEAAIGSLQLGGRRVDSQPHREEVSGGQQSQRRLLWAVLLINFGFFVVEVAAGWWSRSMGLLADGLDMLADAVVYGLSLLAVGAAAARQKRVARRAGMLQVVLAVLGFAEVLRRFFSGSELPDFATMVGVSLAALAGNATCLYLLHQAQNKEEAHFQASLIFTANDVIINLGVIVAGGLVLWLESGLPDLVVGAVVFGLVLQGAVRILRLGR